MKNEYFAIIIVIFFYWYFNLRTDNFITVPMPIEKMSNISIFDGNKI
jgi:hypothetical protein